MYNKTYHYRLTEYNNDNQILNKKMYMNVNELKEYLKCCRKTINLQINKPRRGRFKLYLIERINEPVYKRLEQPIKYTLINYQ